MRGTPAWLALFLVPAALVAQERPGLRGDSLASPAGLESGGFAGPSVRVTRLAGSTGVVFGGRGVWIIHHSIGLGGGYYDLVPRVPDPAPPASLPDRRLGLSYGGVEVEYMRHADRPLHWSVGTLVGGGAVSYWTHGKLATGGSEVGEGPRDGIFVVEPHANLQLSATDFLHFAVGISYRFVSGVTLGRLRNRDLAGPAALFGLRLGRF